MRLEEQELAARDYYALPPIDDSNEPWYRWLPAMRAYGPVVLVLAMAVATPWRTPGGAGGAVAMFTLCLLAAAFGIMWIYRPIWQHSQRALAVHGVFLVVAYGTLVAINSSFAILQMLVYPQVVFSMRLRWSIAGGLTVGALTAMTSVVNRSGDWAAAASGIAASMTAAVMVVAIAVWVRETVTQSLARRMLIEQLEKTRADLAAAERAAGMAEERARLARDIHDTLAQGFTSVIVHLEAASAALGPTNERARGHVKSAEDVARASLADARSIVWALRPETIASAGLAAAMERVGTAAAAVPGGPAVEVLVTGEPRRLPMDVEVTLLRAAQEGLANARRHSGAGRVTVTLTYFEDEVSLDIVDDGHGFDSAAAGGSGGMGLLGMRERAEALGGKLEIESEPGAGTTIAISLPAPGAAAAIGASAPGESAAAEGAR